jgi:hypothetical protein
MKTILILFLTLATSIALNGQARVKMPENVRAIITRSCMDCHADGGNRIAMTHVNFSKWDRYSAAKQAKKSADICKMITKGKMPPKSYRESTPEAVPTKDQADLVCKWSQSIQVKKRP